MAALAQVNTAWALLALLATGQARTLAPAQPAGPTSAIRALVTITIYVKVTMHRQTAKVHNN